MHWKRTEGQGRPFRFLDYKKGKGKVITGEVPAEADTRLDQPLSAADVLAVSTLGQLADNPRVKALRDFVTGWYLSYFSAVNSRGNPESGGQERLSATGDNLANVVQYLNESHPKRLQAIFTAMQHRVPMHEEVRLQETADGRVLLLFKDRPFEEPVLARYVSDGTIKMLVYLTLLHDPAPPPLIGIEEPENYLHPRLMAGLAEECDAAAKARTQLLVTTHSPFFLDRLAPEQVRVLHRDDRGFTKVTRAADLPDVANFVATGGQLGDLWMEGRLQPDGAPALA